MTGSGPGHLSAPGTCIALRATPGASRVRLVEGADGLRVCVTAPREAGHANAAHQKLVAKVAGVANSCLRLLRGLTVREKSFEVL